MNITIKDVAKRAGVSISTVSLVINHKEGVSDELREKVFKTVKQLDYHPNAMARGLKKKESKVIGLVIPDIVNPFFPLVVRGIEDAANKYGYTIILGNTDGKMDEEARYLNLFVEKCVDGIIFIPSSNFKKNISLFSDINLPKIIIDRTLEELNISSVTTDNVLGAYIGTKHLLNNGRRKILFISGPQNLQASKERYNGYLKALKEYDVKEKIVEYGDFTFESGKKVISDVLRRNIKFDAIFGANDVMTLGIILVLAENSINVPDEVEVVGYDNILFSSLSKPALTTIEQPAYKMGFEAVKLVLREIYAKKEAIISRVFKPKLIIRDSSPRRY